MENYCETEDAILSFILIPNEESLHTIIKHTMFTNYSPATENLH